MISASFLPLPLVPQFFTQVFAIAMIRGNKSLCSSELLMNPLTTRRFGILINIFSKLLLPPAEANDLLLPGRECSFILTLMHLTFGIIIPSIPGAIEILKRWLPPGGQFRRKLALWWLVASLTWAVALLLTVYEI